MDYPLNLVNRGDPCALLFLIAVLCFVGNWMVGGNTTIHRWGLRLAAAAYILYGIYGVTLARTPDAGQLVSIALHGLLAAGLTLGISWTVLPIGAFFYRFHRRGLQAVGKGVQRRQAARERRSRQRGQRKREQELRRAALQQEREANARHEGEQTEDRQSRENARAACELLYTLYAPEISGRFPREAFDAFMKKYMGDAYPLDVVEQRAGELQQLIKQHYESVHPPMRFADLSALTAWYERQREQIRSLEVSDRVRQDLLVELNNRYAEFTQETLENQS